VLEEPESFPRDIDIDIHVQAFLSAPSVLGQRLNIYFYCIGIELGMDVHLWLWPDCLLVLIKKQVTWTRVRLVFSNYPAGCDLPHHPLPKLQRHHPSLHFLYLILLVHVFATLTSRTTLLPASPKLRTFIRRRVLKCESHDVTICLG